ncbi:family 31 glycosyl hydrolase, alpha-glucosidase [Galbibacter orientalis DSM 19592]|uniref:Family 31 glycosyl hydrolase, alpha-glucosidase n=1 Tax=Galbibacter orientalis DSM 19592 TaxID=926559 RepID=I3C8M7_9FLAO|nr:TIM-barrel domain-containing protein [Galbibacter orientalis]EIJ39970.1 family 31 glycosyl hydrolase, alpha-glucosidase [Galbibacter orientalis DSM 19592]
MKKRNLIKYSIGALFLLLIIKQGKAQIQNADVLNAPVDVSEYFYDYQNTFYFADKLADFDPKTGKGKVEYKRYQYQSRQAFNNMLMKPDTVPANEFPATEYEVSPNLPFEIQFISDRTVRIKMTSGPQFNPEKESLMLVDGVAPQNPDQWKYSKIKEGHKYTSAHGTVEIQTNPWHVKIFDENGKLLTSTLHTNDVANTYTPVLPFSYVRKNSDYSRSFSAAFTLQPDEKIFGCGESFTQFNKRGQKVVLYTDDANGVQNETMYKPIPFYMSSRGYGVFMHHSTPITVDFGKYFSGANEMMIGDDEADIFIFLGEPKDILDEYTNLTGKSEMPPLWSFGFWMSRITYFSEKEGRNVAKELRKNKIPSDVIHFDTGWFDVDWRNNYEFAGDRFDDPKKMLSDLKDEGFEVCLWQLPYFTPKNTLFNEIVENDLAVKDRKGNIPYEDAVLDFSNPATVTWYQNKLKHLFDLGVSVFKVDFGEAAPANGIYHSGRTGFYEHNLYPLRYNKAVAEITKKEKGYTLIWARSTWAGSQRYPLHWGGDAATTNTAMSATLRGGLSLGLSGFSFWSHDVGGFVTKSPEDLYRRWTPFGMLSSHVRSHGEPPTEPWLYNKSFLEAFRKADNMRYKLMPYIYAQAKESSEKGLPMMRALFVEFPEDAGSWLVDNEYLFGSSMLVAPLFENGTSRDVYLPKGTWIDYQTGKAYEGGWHHIEAGDIPIIALFKNGTVIPHIDLAQSTKDMDWSNLKLKVFASSETTTAKGLVYLPKGEKIETIEVTKEGNNFKLKNNPLQGKTSFSIIK